MKNLVKKNYKLMLIINLITKFFCILLPFIEKYISRNEYINSKSNKVGFIYSLKHFDPDKINNKNELSMTGTSVWAEFFYKFFNSRYKTQYLDFHSKNSNKCTFQIICGLSSWNFIKLSLMNLRSKKILIAVNSHPLYRNIRIMEECKHYKVKLTNECINPFVQLLAIMLADKIILAGNEYIKNTYIKYGVESNKIIPISGGILEDIYITKFEARPTNKVKIIYPTSYLGLRKGILRFLEIFELAYEKNSVPLEVLITGEFCPELNEKIKSFSRKYKECRIKNWMSHNELLAELQSSHIIVSCSIEEGQPHGVLEALSTGCLPFVTRSCGIDLDDKFIVKEWDVSENSRKLLDLISECTKDDNSKYTKIADDVRKSNDWNLVTKKIVNILY